MNNYKLGADALLNKANTYIVLDTEATGFQPNEVYGKLLEISAVKITDWKKIDEFTQLVNPDIRIPKKIVELTGITDEMVREQPNYTKAVRDFFEFCKGDDVILVGHNLEYDLKFLNFFANLLGLEFTQPVLDTLPIAKSLIDKDAVNKSYKLKNLCEYFHIEDNAHHRAMNDAVCTWHLMEKLRDLEQERAEKNAVCGSLLMRSATFCNNEVGDYHIERVVPWTKQIGKNKYYCRLYVTLRATKNGHMEDATVFFDLMTRHWGVKQTTFVLDDFKEIQSRTMQYIEGNPTLKRKVSEAYRTARQVS